MNGGIGRISQRSVEFLGYGLSIVVGALIGMGQISSLLFVVLAFTVLVVALLGLRAFVESPDILGMWLMAGAILTVPWNAVRVSDSVTAGDLFVVLSLPIALASALRSSRSSRIPAWLLLSSSLLVLSVLILEMFPAPSLIETASSFGLNQDGTAGNTSNLVGGVRLIVALVVFPLVVATLATTWEQVRLLVNVWLIGVAISCTVAMLDAYAGLRLQEELTRGTYFSGEIAGQSARYVGLTVHPTTLSLTAAMATPVVLSRMTSFRNAAAYSPLLLLLVTAILVSGSRSGIVTLVAAMVLMFAWNQRTRKALAIAALLAVGAATVFIGASSFSTTERFQSSSRSAGESNSTRLVLFRESIDYIEARPITGQGFQVARGPHNTALQLLLSGGLIALVGFATAIFGYLRAGWRLRLRAPPWLRGDAIGLTIAIVVFLISGLVDNDIYDRYLYIPAALILAMSVIAANEKKSA